MLFSVGFSPRNKKRNEFSTENGVFLKAMVGCALEAVPAACSAKENTGTIRERKRLPVCLKKTRRPRNHYFSRKIQTKVAGNDRTRPFSSRKIDVKLTVETRSSDAHWLHTLHSAEKSEHLHIGKATGQRVTMRGVPIPQVKHHRHPGLVMNNKLSWTEHIKDVYGTCSRMIGILRRLCRRLQGTTVKAIFIGAIRPRIEYASQVWSGRPTQSLQRLQDSFCKRHRIRLPPLQTRFDYHSLVLLYKMRSSLVPPYLCTLLPRRVSATAGYSFRKSGYPVPATTKSQH